MRRASRLVLTVSVAWLALSCRIGYDELGGLAAGSGGLGAGASGGASAGGGGVGLAGSSSDAGETNGMVEGGAPSSAGSDSGGADAIGGEGNMSPGGSGGTAGSGGSGGSGGAPVGCRVATFDGHDYAFCDSGLSFTSAALDCSASGMYPLRIDSADEQTWVHSQIPTADQDNNSTALWRWIGADDPGLTGDWRWSDGEQFWSGGQQGSPVGGLYDNWVQNHPLNARGCVAMEARSGGWYAMDCPQVRPYVCERY